jgi:membrane protease YdiL (CAAX protease family)
VAAGALGPGPGRLLQAAAFGLSHVVDARRTGEPVIGTVLATGMAGWLFGWLTARSGSVVAPMLVHLAVNEAGAVAAMAVQRRGPAADSCD